VRRRAFLGTVAGGLLAAPFAAEGQQAAKIARIGYLTSINPGVNPHTTETFRQELRDLGYIEGRNLVIEYRSAEGNHPPNAAAAGGRSDPVGESSIPEACPRRSAPILL